MIIFAAVAGVCFGSFAGVLVYRIPRRIGFVKGRSVCAGCGGEIRARRMIPVISYIALKGKCEDCGAGIGVRYFVIEVLGGVLGLAAVWRFGPGAAAASAFACFLLLAVIAFVDAEHMIIPNGLVVALMAAAAVHAAAAGDFSLPDRAAGMAVISVPMLLAALMIKDAFGGGDIKLMAVCGFLLGIRFTLLAAFIAAVLGGAHGILVKASGKKDRHIPFGPHICAGASAAMVFGEEIIGWYMSFF